MYNSNLTFSEAPIGTDGIYWWFEYIYIHNSTLSPQNTSQNKPLLQILTEPNESQAGNAAPVTIFFSGLDYAENTLISGLVSWGRKFEDSTLLADTKYSAALFAVPASIWPPYIP